MTTVPALRVHLLGAFRVLVDASPVPATAWRSRPAAALVKALALAPLYRLHREQVAGALWPDLDPTAQANNLNVSAFRARQALAAAGAPPGVFVIRLGDTIVLGPPEAVWVDAAAFESAAAAAWRSDTPGAFRAALALADGDLLAGDPYEEWVDARRSAFRTARLAALSRLGQLHEAVGETGDAIETYGRIVALDPAHEEAGRALMRLHAGQGQRASALAHFDRLVEVLRHELDAAPEPATAELAAAIRAGRYLAPVAAPPRDASPSGARPREAIPGAVARPLAAENLPVAPDEFVGRERERAEIGQMLATGRLVTLTGPGGIGKTRLALAVAQERRGSFPGGVVFVDLAPLQDLELVVAAVAHALGVQAQGGQSALDAVVARLRDERLLLLLDNFEHLTAAALVVRALLDRSPRLTVLVTSRTGLRLGGEREYPVPPLSVPVTGRMPDDTGLGDVPAVALFVHRARAIKPGFHLTAANSAAIAEICRRLDGLPLAIELAAARIKVLTPEAMVTRLDHPLTLLAGGRRDLPARQQTIRQSITWSHDLLSPPEQRLLRRLAVFAGGWTLDAAEAIVDLDGALGIDVLDGLASLVDKSLVLQRDPPGRAGDGGDGVRFGLLETIREFGIERLRASGDEEERLRDRHGVYFLALAERARPLLESTDQAVWLDRLEREEGNLRAAFERARGRGDSQFALRLAVALQMFWFIRGRIGEACDRLLAAVALPGSAAFPGLRADALNAVALLARDGDEALAYRASCESRSVAHAAGDRQREADALANLGYLALQRNDLSEAHAVSETCLKVNRELGNRQGVADAASVLALVAAQRGDLDAAVRLNHEGLAIWTDLDDHQGVVWARTRLAAVRLLQGKESQAFAELTAALRTARALAFHWGLSWAYDGLAHLAAAGASNHLAASFARLAAAVRAEAGLRLSASEQAAVDRLTRRLDAALGDAASDGSACPPPDELIDALRTRLGLAADLDAGRREGDRSPGDPATR